MKRSTMLTVVIQWICNHAPACGPDAKGRKMYTPDQPAEHSFTRRDFLRHAGHVGMGAAGIVLLAACGGEPRRSPRPTQAPPGATRPVATEPAQRPSTIPMAAPAPILDGPFLMQIEEIFTIKGRGTVVTGTVQRGTIVKDDEVEIVGLREQSLRTVVTGIEMFQKSLDQAQAADVVGLLVRGVERADVEPGMVVAEPGSITPHRHFRADVYVLRQEEGGRNQAVANGYRPQFNFWATDVTGAIALPEGVEMVLPGESVTLDVELIAPVAMEEGTWFAIREGGVRVGHGIVTGLLD